MIARNDVGQDFFVSVADMRRRIRVIDGRGDEERLGHFARQTAGRIVVGQPRRIFVGRFYGTPS